MGEDVAHLTEHHVAQPALGVAAPGAHQSDQHRRAQHRLLRGQRIGDAYAFDPGSQQVEVIVATESGGPALVHAQVDHRIAQASTHHLSVGETTGFRPARRTARQARVTVEPRNLLNDVGSAGSARAHVETRTGRGDLPGSFAAHDELQTFENVAHVTRQKVHAQRTLKVEVAQGQCWRHGKRADSVEWTGHPEYFGVTLTQQCDEARDGEQGEFGVDAPFEAD